MRKLFAFFMLVAVLALGIVVGACSSGGVGGEKVGDTYIYYIHDTEHKVGIWQASGGSISVLPDSVYTK